MIRALAALIIALAGSVSAQPSLWQSAWPDTDFSKTTVEDWSEIISGGPPKDGIPALSDPDFHAVSDERGLEPREPVIALELEGATPRAYPIRYLIWHEIVNDEVAGVPVAVTFCPLCNSGLTFDRRTEVGVLEFGVSGKLRHSDMIMFDRETESWWQQAIGEAIVGELTGTRLQGLPSWMESWQSFAERNPGGLVMSEPTEHRRRYGANPYVRYDSADRPFLYSGESPPHGISPLERVVRVGDRAWPLSRLSEEDRIEEAGVVLSWSEGQASALDTQRISEGRDVGDVRVRDGTGQDLPHDVMFAFAFHAFWPEGQWMLARD
ncbi:DUF3179 domain-containing protein [Histidinibacterium aquaticum]|uniref:DUF3179 domain-containing protein n=1 Tax=Histidinibacterium aquaticum TaxID=2613962 RepID=A0A5J5GN14_9RHOB|nr:DUF3179 domain-containing protein [Histidinibacterium aquaticum]KAA9009103.1 DUF3179 domain-containing protein [Histidinibacterium aquaticum]